MSTFLLIAVILLQIADIVSTVYALRNPNVREVNPLLQPLFDKFGALPVLLVVKIMFISFLLIFKDQLSILVLVIMLAGYIYVIVNNINVIKRMKNDSRNK